ncbi:MAG: S-layer homology domain-containing protein [Syntrophomonas sp.]
MINYANLHERKIGNILNNVLCFQKIVSLTAVIVVFAFLIMFCTPKADAVEIKEPDGKIALFSKSPILFNEWYEQDKLHLQEIVNLYAENPEKASLIVYHEWQEIASLMTKLAVAEAYHEPTQGYMVYPSMTSGKLHVLGCAKFAREAFQEMGGNGTIKTIDINKIYPDVKCGSGKAVEGLSDKVEYLPAREEQYTSLNTAIKVLNGLSLPEKTLNGYSIFLMPYEFKDLGGYSYSTGLPHVDEAAFISAAHGKDTQGVEKAITHEVGHFLHQQYMGEYSPQNELWQHYLDLRGRQWQKGNWDSTTTENFAEDFRMSCGEAAAITPHDGTYGTPDPSIKKKLAEYFQALPANRVSLPLEFGYLGVYPGSQTASMQINGLERTNTILIDGQKLELRGIFKINAAGYEAVAYLKGNDYENCFPLKMLPEGIFALDIELPGSGSYDLIIGTKNEKTIITYQLFKLLSFGIPNSMNKLESQADLLITALKSDEHILNDINGHWAEGYIDNFANLGFAAGYPDNTFRPENAITRAEFLALIVKIFSLEANPDAVEQRFIDVNSKHWAFNIVNSAYSFGIIPAKESDKLFRPDQPITRGEMLELFKEFFLSRNSLIRHENLLVLNIFQGYSDGSFRLEQTSTRAEAVVVLKRLLLWV